MDIDAIADEAGRILQTDSSSWTWSRNDVVTRSLPRMQTPASMPAPPPGTWLAGDWTADPSIETAVGSGIIVARQILATD